MDILYKSIFTLLKDLTFFSSPSAYIKLPQSRDRRLRLLLIASIVTWVSITTLISRFLWVSIDLFYHFCFGLFVYFNYKSFYINDLKKF